MMYFGKTCFVLALGVLIIPASVFARPLIVEEGQPRAQIVIAEQPTRSAKLAADELRKFVEEMTGATLPIGTEPDAAQPVTIYIGESRHTESLGISVEGLEQGAFKMVSGEDWLALVGHDRDHQFREPYAHHYGDQDRVMAEWDAMTGEKWGNPYLSISRQYSASLDIWEIDERGSLNAVYAFLRDQGMRWYFPGKIGQIIPELRSIALPEVDRTVEPDFAVRDLFIYYSEFQEARPGLGREDDIRWMLWLGLRPKETEWGSAGGHGAVAVTKRPEVRETNPEFYALWGGKRAFETARYGAQCFSSEGLFEQHAAYARTVFDHYDQPMVNTGPGDSYLSLCQCELCEGKATPDRGWTGQLSDYVWDYTQRLATELYKTHPDHWVSNIAYSTYQMPPEKIDEFSPNVALIYCRWRSGLHDPEAREAWDRQLETWMSKLPSKKLYLWDYYLHARAKSLWEAVPVYFPRVIADDLRALKGVSSGEYIEVFGNGKRDDSKPWHALATNHLNCYVTARLWWDADQDLDALLDEYYEKFYGPAEAEMKAFVEYAESNWMKTIKDHGVIDRLFELIGAAQAAAGDADTVYGERVEMVVDYMQRLTQLRDRLAKGRGDNPKARMRWRDSVAPQLDGKLDDAFWEDIPIYTLTDLKTGVMTHNPTTVRLAWHKDEMYVAVHCQDSRMSDLKITAQVHDDTNIWNGDAIEILLETQVNAYYQIAISPAGAVVDLDRQGGGFNLSWTSNVEAFTHHGDDGWTLEARIPIVGEMQAEVDPLNGVAGRKPQLSYPWYVNVCRQRPRDGASEMSALAPTGEANFHLPAKFAELFVP